MKLSSVLIAIGLIGIIAGLAVFIFTFYPIIKAEVNYQFDVSQGNLRVKRGIKPSDTDFGIVIPKILASAKIIPDVDPFNKYDYQLALTQGIAHVRGTSYPGNKGNMFLFAHSSVNFFEALKYNSVFYLLDKMEDKDEIDLYYKGQKFKYLVTGKRTVNADEVKYLSGSPYERTVTLMTCWPPGTTFKRLIVTGVMREF